LHDKTRQDTNLYSQIKHKLQWYREVTTEKYNTTNTWQTNNRYIYTYNIYITTGNKRRNEEMLARQILSFILPYPVELVKKICFALDVFICFL
jgi:hypothetical protein